jgi:hypothetical protein
MQVGSLVQYKANETDAPQPAIVMGIWPEGTIQLHVFHFESATHVRAAHPAQVTPVLDASKIEEILVDFETLGRRLTDLEEEMAELRQLLRENRLPPSTTEPAQEPVVVDASLIDTEDEDESPDTFFPEPPDTAEGADEDKVPVESTSATTGKSNRKGRAAWPR